MSAEAPPTFDDGGTALWDGVTASVVLDAGEQAILVEACRAKDRCDRLAAGGPWRAASRGVPSLDVGEVARFRLARATALSMMQLLAALRLPDERGRRPGRRPPRGVYRPRQPGRNRR